MSGTNAVVVGILPKHFQSSDASAVIGLAAATVAAMGAVGNADPKTLDAVLLAASETFRRMRPEAQENLLAAANEMVAALHAGKQFMALGSFETPPAPPGKSG